MCWGKEGQWVSSIWSYSVYLEIQTESSNMDNAFAVMKEKIGFLSELNIMERLMMPLLGKDGGEST